MVASVRKLEPALCELARENCNEDPDMIASYLTSLQTWIKKSPHLKARTTEQLLVAFLRRCQYRLEDTKKRIDAYYSLKNAFPDVLCERNISESLLDIYSQGVHIIPMKPIQSNGPRVIISQYSKCNPKKSTPRELFKLLFMLLEMIAIEDDNATVAGVAYVIDARDVTVEQMMQYDPFLLKKTWILVDQCLPIKFTEIHLINVRPQTVKIFNFVTTFLPQKMPMKFIVHTKAEDLYEHIPRDAMTIEYGGHNGYGVEAIRTWKQKLDEYKPYFAEDQNYGTNEKLRVGLNSCLEIGELSGLNGSFRKLQVD